MNVKLGLSYEYKDHALSMITPLTEKRPGITWVNESLESQHGYVITNIIICVMKFLIPSQTSTVEPLKFGNG